MNKKRVLHPDLCAWPLEDKYCVTERGPAWWAKEVGSKLSPKDRGVGEEMEKREPSGTVGEIINVCSH